MTQAREWLSTGLCLCALLLFSGCASYSQRFDAIETQMAAGDFTAALMALDKDRGGTGDAVLYLLNRAMLLRLQGDFAQSNREIEKAKVLIDELDAASVSETAASLTINDNLQSYVGDEYERALLYFYAALNYLQMGNPSAARVEALQLDVSLKVLADRRGDDFIEDASVRYLNGLIFEQLGEWSDAMIAYRRAYQNYQQSRNELAVPPPHSLGLALVRLSEYLGLNDELREYRKAFAIDQWTPLNELREQGELVVVVGTGLSPIKRQQSATIFAPELGVMVRIATPRFEPRPQWVANIQLTVGDKSVPVELLEDVDARALKALDDQMLAITARALARAVLKYRAAKEARGHNEGLGLLVNLAGMLSEQADTRSWSTLPQRIYLARASLAPGQYDVSLQIMAEGGRVLAVKTFPAVVIAAGQKAYRSWRWIAPVRPPSRGH